MRRIILATLVLTIVACGTQALAKGPTGIAVTDVDGKKLILVSFDEGVVFFDTDGATFRKFDSRDGIATDVNGDGQVDFAAVGKPLFVIGADGEPVWANDKGCSEALLGNIAGGNDLEIFCRRGNTLTVYAADGNVVWELGVSGMKVKGCSLKDLEGNGLMDVECPTGKKFFQVSGQGSVISEGADVAGETTGPTFTPPGVANVGDEAANNLFDFNGDGTVEEYLVTDAGDTMVQSKSAPKPLAIIDIANPIAAAIADIDGDGVVEVVVVADGRLAALDKDADKTVLFDTTFNRAKLKRQPVVEFGTIGTSSIEGTEDELRTSMAAHAPELGKCYTKKLKKDRFLKVGRVSVRAMVDTSGKVTEVKQSFSTLNDKDVEACVAKALGKLTLPKATKDDGGYASIDMIFGYEDK